MWPYRRKRDTGGGWAFRVKRLTRFLVRFLCFMCEVQDASPRLPAPCRHVASSTLTFWNREPEQTIVCKLPWLWCECFSPALSTVERMSTKAEWLKGWRVTGPSGRSVCRKPRRCSPSTTPRPIWWRRQRPRLRWRLSAAPAGSCSLLRPWRGFTCICLIL